VTWGSSGQDGSGDGIYAQRYAIGGTVVGDQFQGNTSTDGSQSSPAAAALSDGGWLMTWAGVGVGDASGIYAQRYAENGTAVGEEFWVNAYTESPQGSPAITVLSDGDWLVVWQSFGQDGSGDGVYAQRFSIDGAAVGGEFQVNTYTEGTQDFPAITALTDGGWLIAWQSSGQDGSGDGIYAQRYSADGDAVGGEFQVNTYTESIQGSPALTALPEGGWVAAWKSYGQDGSFFGVYAQRFAADGTTVGDEFQVNTYSDGVQEEPDITTLSDGGWLMVWESYGQDGAFDGIYGQRYAADGTTVGNEFRVNTYTASTQTSPDVAALPDGGWLVTWQSYGQDGSDFGIYSQRYAADGTAYSTGFDLKVTIDLTSFNPLAYIASHGDLINAFGFDVNAAVSHYLAFGFDEGRETTFDPDWYIAKYADLRNAFGEDTDAATRHYIANGFFEGRSVDTSGDDYLIGSALNDVLPGSLGNDTLDGGEGIDKALFSGKSAGYRLSYSSGTVRVQDIDALDGDEGVDTLVSVEILDFSDRDMRLDNFDGLAYIVSHPDLIEAFGADREAGLAHYVSYGFHEGRQQDFDPDWYISAHHDLRNAFGEDIDSSTMHYFNFGRNEGRNVDASGDDSLLGSHGDDILPGFAGNDTIDGKEGNDTARFFGDAAGYRLDYSGGVITVFDIDQTDGNDGIDTLRNVEILEFADRVLSLVGFDPLAYISTHADLLQAFGSNAEAGLSHYIAFGFQEGRSPGAAEAVGLLGQADAVNDPLL